MNYLDSLYKEKRRLENPDWPLARFLIKHKKSSCWLRESGPVKNFTTGNSKRYLTQEELNQLRKEKKTFPAGLAEFRDYVSGVFSNQVKNMTLARAWNISLVGSIIFGMFLMGAVYHYLGQGVSAEGGEARLADQKQESFVLGESETKQKMDTETEISFIAQLLKEYENQAGEETSQDILEKKIKVMTEGYPIEKMASEIAQKDKIVAAFLIGIAKKESGWGLHVPVLNGQDCYNYWGYRGIRKRMGTGGHTCFDSPKDAVDTVSKRIETLIYDEKRNTPGKMVEVWKCGYDCSWDNPRDVKKWVSDVDMYFRKFDKN